MLIKILGSAAGGGLPQWNCNGRNSADARSGVAGLMPRTQASVAVNADGAAWVLLNAAPDLRQQINDTAQLHPAPDGPPRNSPISARGAFSNLVCMAPKLSLCWFAMMERGEWGPALEIQARISRFYEEGAVPLRKAGYVIDKSMAVLGGVPGATRSLRPPYVAPPDELYRVLEAAARRHVPEAFA